MATNLDLVEIDEARLKAERAADADLLSLLNRNGDCASVIRSIDFHCIGSEEGISELSAKSADLGYIVLQSEQTPDGETYIDLSIESDILPATIDHLTVKALKIEKRFDLRFDGWGTVNTKC